MSDVLASHPAHPDDVEALPSGSLAAAAQTDDLPCGRKPPAGEIRSNVKRVQILRYLPAGCEHQNLFDGWPKKSVCANRHVRVRGYSLVYRVDVGSVLFNHLTRTSSHIYIYICIHMYVFLCVCVCCRAWQTSNVIRIVVAVLPRVVLTSFLSH